MTSRIIKKHSLKKKYNAAFIVISKKKKNYKELVNRLIIKINNSKSCACEGWNCELKESVKGE